MKSMNFMKKLPDSKNKKQLGEKRVAVISLGEPMIKTEATHSVYVCVV